ncbi:MAG TPA: PAS domain S-box protein [Gemmatimonadaceae bacterium]|nr:PAS domain S-box protein [Gemmatimonadaceae bacterium]
MTDRPNPPRRPSPNPTPGGAAITPDHTHRVAYPAFDVPGGHAARSPGGIAHETGELHRLLVESVQDYAIFALDPNGYILSWNAGAERIKGYSADEIVGKHFSIFYPHEKIAQDFPQYELEVAGRTGRFEDEGWRLRKDGTRFWANVVITALRDDTGRLVGFAKVTRDLSERRIAEDALRASEERFRLLVQGVRDYAIFLLDPTGHIATWNDGAERIKGYTADEIIGRHFSIFYPREDVASGKVDHELEIAMRGGTFEEEGWRIRKDGSRFWANVVITALRNDDGHLVGFAKVTRDLTERRESQERALEDARRVATEEAGRRGAEERARELHALADQLRQQTVELEKANRAKAEFLAAMSHELRTPLNAIGGYAELLAMGISGPVTDQQREQLERIRRSQQHLLGIINDILNFSRIEAGQLSYDFSAVPLHAMVESVAPMVAPQAQLKGLRLERSGCAPGVAAWADRSKLEQILLNLLSNAVKFTEAGGVVSLSCGHSGGSALFTVRDSGVGIPADQTEAIFEPFVQVGRTLTSMREGTGLGLAISRDLARAMGGEITVQSQPGAGSTFTLRLPLAQER